MVPPVLSLPLRSLVGLVPTFAADTAAMCHSAVMALSFGRTPREGTAGHVASRRGLDPDETARRPLRGLGRGRGQPGDGPADEPAWTVARREEAEARAEHPCHAGKRPGARGRRVAPQTGLAAAAGNGTPQPPRRNGKRKVRQGQLAACLRIRRALHWQGERIAHHNLAAPRPPRAASRSGARPFLPVAFHFRFSSPRPRRHGAPCRWRARARPASAHCPQRRKAGHCGARLGRRGGRKPRLGRGLRAAGRLTRRLRGSEAASSEAQVESPAGRRAESSQPFDM